MNSKVAKPVGHIALSFSKEDEPRLTDRAMAGIALDYMERMGIRNTQYLIARHFDKEHPHMHIAYNRFVIEGNYKYTYNNGHLAMADTHAAAVNFLNALEKIPTIIDQYKSKNEAVAGDSGQGVEEGGRTETVEIQTCRPRPQDSAGACAATARSHRKGERQSARQTGDRICAKRIFTICRRYAAADTQSRE